MSPGGFQGGGKGMWAGSTEEVGPQLPKISSLKKRRGDTCSFPTPKLPRYPSPTPLEPRRTRFGGAARVDRQE